MKRVNVVQIGAGTVGGALLEQIGEHGASWRDELGLDIRVHAVAGRGGARVASTDDGMTQEEVRGLVEARRSGEASGDSGASIFDAIRAAVNIGPTVVIDAAASDETAEALVYALDQGAGAVLSNKAPLALPAGSLNSITLWEHALRTRRLRYEATCGAGLPVISTLRSLLDTGDQIIEISGTLSGTLGAIFSDVGAGRPFSEAVRLAKDAGYTEPDPRDDLSGLDVARKALILARTSGQAIDLDDIAVHSLVPTDLETCEVDEFLERINRSDGEIDALVRDARSQSASLKYIAHVPSEGPVTVGFQAAPATSVMGALQGPENIASFRTRRYDTYPTVVSGPGAGAEVTAAGMAADMLQLAHWMA